VIKSNHPQILLETCATSDRVTGLERVGDTLYGRISNLIECDRFCTSTTSDLIGTQYLKTPGWLVTRPRGIVVPITFPPSLIATKLFSSRVIPYIHDLFLISNETQLTYKARTYMKPAFKRALATCSTFLTNSETTRRDLVPHCRFNSNIILLRPAVDDLFSLKSLQPLGWSKGETLRLVAIGTVEPRKGYDRLVRFRSLLESIIDGPVTLDVIGRKGWGSDWALLSADDHITLHGYASETETRRVIDKSHALISGSYNEGLGLPLLEVQHGSRLVIASDIPAHREVLGDSGLLVDFEDMQGSAHAVASYFISHSLVEAGIAAKRNIGRWNRLADDDLSSFVKILTQRILNAG
jgi:glycosyltransferase involved in cell wall biosynthesis